jgi:hypothetical protein
VWYAPVGGNGGDEEDGGDEKDKKDEEDGGDEGENIAILTLVKYRHSFFVHGSWFMVHR